MKPTKIRRNPRQHDETDDPQAPFTASKAYHIFGNAHILVVESSETTMKTDENSMKPTTKCHRIYLASLHARKLVTINKIYQVYFKFRAGIKPHLLDSQIPQCCGVPLL